MQPLSAAITPQVQRQRLPGRDEAGMLQAKGTVALPPSAEGIWHESHSKKVNERGGSIGLQGAPTAPASQSSSRTIAPEETQQPDEEFAARFRGLRTGCLKDGSVVAATSIDENNSDKALGRLAIHYEGEGRTKYSQDKPLEERVFAQGKIQRANGKFCFCDCMHYRQYLQGVGWTGPVGGTANVPIAETASAGTTLPLDAQWHEEDLATVLGKNLLQTGCSREVTDRPGIERGARAGVPVMMRYNLYLQIWDACQQRELWHDARALTIGGNTPPRTILWSSSHQPLSRASISSDILAEETAEEPPETRANGRATSGPIARPSYARVHGAARRPRFQRRADTCGHRGKAVASAADSRQRADGDSGCGR